MGNRGVLHDADERIKRAWRLRRWIVCVLEFRGRKRRVMAPGRYTELFFLDEATALAAGHRPCAECRHVRFLDFCNAWGAVHPADSPSTRPTADEIDRRLHAERIATVCSLRSFVAALNDLPDGVIVAVAAWGKRAFLVRGNYLLAWSSGGYGKRRLRPKNESVQVLTPKSTVETIRAGYVPEIHASAEGVS
jgi:hypothetical protein